MPEAYASTVIEASADEVWGYLRHFANLADWIPGVTRCEIEDGRDELEIGAVRRVEAASGVFRERLTGWDDTTRTQTYEIVDSALPVTGYRATLRVQPVTDTGRAFLSLTSTFDAEDPEMAVALIENQVYAPAMAALHDKF